MSAKTSIQSDVLIRGFAIAAVVFNHAAALPNRPFELGGGVNALIILSGYSFARFALSASDIKSIRKSTLLFGYRFALATIPLILAAFVLLKYFDISEALFYTNIVHTSRLKLLYTWYPPSYNSNLFNIIWSYVHSRSLYKIQP